ncbi:hypothetical protein BV20DRAFT_1046523 [Pilatotrama ljubarskyi]|nr:hypothetical protein BV20DRAFT_1046523 [Pilatotrama ljubarskyi]
MPPARSLIRRRRSSLAMGLTQVKPGNYGITHNSSPRALTFAPNITPGTYVEADDDMNGDSSPPSPTTALFPPTAPQTSAPTRRRLPPGKRLSQGYIPRPPNAFMLFRANFVRQKHVPGSIETNHGSLSKIIGNCWRALPLEEKKYWEIEAKKAKAAHKERYPHYRFRPVHNKNKKKAEAAAAATDAAGQAEGGIKRKDKLPTLPAEEERCEAVAQLLLEGKKGEELAEAVRQLDMVRAMSRPESAASGAFPGINPSYTQPQVPSYLQRRPSSVPPPSTLFHPGHPIALPSIPFFAAPAPQMAFPAPNGMFNPAGYGMGSKSAHGSRAPSPVSNIARTRTYLGLRRASSCQPIPSERMWDGYDAFSNAQQHQQDFAHMHMHASPAPWQLQPDNEPLPEVTDASIFQPGWANSFKDEACAPNVEYTPVDPHSQTYSPREGPPHALSLNIGPLDSFDFSASAPSTATDGYSVMTPGTGGMYDPIDPHMQWPVESGPSSTFSGSPARSDASLPANSVVSSQDSAICAPQPQHPQLQFDAWSDAEGSVSQQQSAAQSPDAQHFSALSLELEKSYQPQGYDVYDADFSMGLDASMEMGPADYGFCASQEY